MILSFDGNKLISKLEIIPNIVFNDTPNGLSSLYTYDASILRCVVVSRITKIKNLIFLVHVFSKIDFPCILDIYGPVEDKNYFSTLFDSVGELPKNVKFEYKGHLESSRVSEVISLYDLFLFPTFGENFGHVVFEALSAGTPIIISPNTPWDEESSKAIFVCDLIPDIWVTKMSEFYNMKYFDVMSIRTESMLSARNFEDKNSKDSSRLIDFFNSL